MLLQIIQQAVDSRIAGIFRHRLSDELRLAALAVRRNNQPPGDLVGREAAVTLADDVEATVERRRGAR